MNCTLCLCERIFMHNLKYYSECSGSIEVTWKQFKEVRTFSALFEANKTFHNTVIAAVVQCS